MAVLSLDDMQEAAKLVEIEGQEAYNTVRERYGEDAARLLLVAHLRRSFGAMDTYPPDPDIDHRVWVRLTMMGVFSRPSIVK